ncbi:ABC transporter ATP-binding protein [Streptomyces chrestomyceticus]|uniref:ABC transporter ATP-binding protein n=1 Tax=Streptomyces chrestomyceticus TaxID=68185 RepID=UPI0035A96506
MNTAIACRGLTKFYGTQCAVENVAFDVRSGTVCALLGRNGSGKSTTLRMLLGLSVPDAGTALIQGSPYAELDDPARVVGAAVTDVAGHPAFEVRTQLRMLAHAVKASRQRVDEVLEQIGLTDAQFRKIDTLSVGMRQRLSLGCALMGSPEILVLDEPASGLDPDGIRWLRTFLKDFADQGGTVLLSSHSLDEVQRIAHDVVLVNRTVLYAGLLSDLVTGGHDDSLEDAFYRVTNEES